MIIIVFMNNYASYMKNNALLPKRSSNQIVLEVIKFTTSNIINRNVFLDIINEWPVSTNKNMRDLCTIIHKSAKIFKTPRENELIIIMKLIDEIPCFIDQINSQGISNLFWALAILDINIPKINQCILDFIPREIENFNPQSISTVFWVFARFNINNSVVNNFLLNALIQKINDYNEYYIVNTLVSLSKLNIINPKVNDCLVNAILKKDINIFYKESIVNIFTALPNLKINNSELIKDLLKFVIQRINDFNYIGLERILLSLAMLNINNSEVNNLLIKAIISNINGFHAGNLSNILWSLATLNITNHELNKLLLLNLVKKQYYLTSNHVVNTIWALAKLDINDPYTNKYLCNNIISKKYNFNSHDISTILWVVGTLNINNSELNNYLLNIIPNKISDFTSENIANVLWAMTALNINNPIVTKCLVNAISSVLFNFNSSQSRQVLQAHYLLNLNLNESILKELNNKLGSNNLELSDFQKDIKKILNDMNFIVYEDFKLFNGLYLSNLVIIINNEKINIECDSESCYSNPIYFDYKHQQILTTNTFLRNSIYNKYNIKFIAIPYFLENKETFIREQLDICMKDLGVLKVTEKQTFPEHDLNLYNDIYYLDTKGANQNSDYREIEIIHANKRART